MSRSGPRIAVIGAGIVGASIAYHLARREAAVTLVDRGPPAGAVTGKAFGWINVSHSMPEPYVLLRKQAIEDYRRLERELGDALRIDWSGALTWYAETAETERLVRGHAALGYDMRLAERDEIAGLEPNLIAPPDCAAYAFSEGTLEPAAATEALVAAAERAGADVRLGCEAIALDACGGRIASVGTARGTLESDVVIMAAGTRSAALCAPLGVALPIESSPALLLRFAAPGRLVNRVISNPDFEVRQAADGGLVVAEDFHEGADPDAIAQSSLAAIEAGLRGADGMVVQSADVGHRPIPLDDLPIVGFSAQVEGLYVASMHAGVTLAAAVGRFAAMEVLDGVEVDLLEGCRPARFAP